MITTSKILFLQGPPTPFWRDLSLALERRGHTTAKINLCLGDQLFWWRRGATNFRGRLKNWRRFLGDYVAANGITHIIYYADRFAYHAIAAEVAAERGITAIVIENGYLRPDWITLERGGMGAFSHFPADPAKIRRIAERVAAPDLAVRYSHTFAREMFYEVSFHLSSYFYRFLFPFYRSGKFYDPMVDYLSGLRRVLRRKSLERQADTVVEDLVANRRRFFLVVLQLQGDYQIRDNSPYRHIREMVEEVIASFAADAPEEDQLIFKLHPHDNALESWPRVVADAARRAGLSDRVRVIDGGHLERLLGTARGTVTINSTVGLYALRAGCPVKVLGTAIYDMPGLTHQGPLAGFWREPQPVDPGFAADFARALAATIQVKGSFLDPAGRKAAIGEIVRRIEDGCINQPDAFEPVPPRLRSGSVA